MSDNTQQLSRATDPETSREAAAVIAPKLNVLQSIVLQALQEHGPMCDEQLIALPELSTLRDSTIRTRRSELVKRGKVKCVGTVKNSLGRNVQQWEVTGD